MKRFSHPGVLLLVILLVPVALLTNWDALSATGQSAPLVEPEPRVYLPLMLTSIPPRTEFDMADFMVGDGRLYEVWQKIVSNNTETQARHQTQFVTQRFYHTKGNEIYAEWEELWMDDEFVYRGTDTSPGAGLYYTLRDSSTFQYGSRWSPRHWKVGDVYQRNPLVTFYHKDNCDKDREGTQETWLRFEAYYPRFTLGSGIVVEEVVVLDWLLSPGGQPEERYYYARDFGLVAWENAEGDYSHVSEVHNPGARPDNTREVIGCLNLGDLPIPDGSLSPLLPNEPPYRAK